MRRALTLALLVTACGGTAATTTTTAPVVSTTTTAADPYAEPWQKCEAFITPTLVSPATAVWAETYETAEVLSPEGSFPVRYELTGYLDSENIAGGFVRWHVRCEVTLTEEGVWRLAENFVR